MYSDISKLLLSRNGFKIMPNSDGRDYIRKLPGGNVAVRFLEAPVGAADELDGVYVTSGTLDFGSRLPRLRNSYELWQLIAWMGGPSTPFRKVGDQDE